MATFNSATDASGKDVVRCFVKGAAPAVIEPRRDRPRRGRERAVGRRPCKKKAEDAVTRMEGEGQRVMAAAVRDLDPATFDADGDLLGYVTDLEMASLVAMVDPPREASKAAVHDAQRAHIRVRMVTGDDVTTGAAIAKQLGIPGEAMLGTEFAALSDEERLARIDDIGVVGRVAPEHKVLLVETLRKKGDVVAMTGDGVNDAPAIKAADIGIAMGTGTAGGQERRPHDPLGRQLRHHRARGREGPEGLRQPQQVHPLRDARARGVHHHVPRGQHPQHRRRAAVLARRRSSTSTSWSTRRSASRSAWTRRRRASWTCKPRSRDASIMTTGLLTTAGLVGLFMAVCTLALISYGTSPLRQRRGRHLDGADRVLAAPHRRPPSRPAA